jgi:catalase
MASKKKAAPAKKSATGAPRQAGARSDSGPRRKTGNDPAARQALAVDAAAGAMPFNAIKAAEHDLDAAVRPLPGPTIELDPAFTASTLSEADASEKAGEPASPGENPLPGPLPGVRVSSDGRALTTNQGTPVGDNQNSLKAGVRGPVLLEDFILREKITHFDHERIPERIVHARGSGAHGFFEAYDSFSRFTRAAPFQAKGKRTPVFVRFSTVQGERGSKDTARDVRGFAVKFYTDEGNWDLVGNNIPVFFIQDAMKFPDLVHAVKPEPHHGMPQAGSAHDTFWDFVSLMPESTHMLMWAMSDRAIPRSYRMMQGFGVHTFRLVNERGQAVLCKFHWSPLLGTHALTWDEAVKISGADPDYHRRDLWEAIESGEFPEYELGVQVFTEEEADAFPFDVLDATKLVPEEMVPITPLGRMVLNRNPDNFFAETEQVAFCVAHVIPGIDFTHDPLLAGRIHSYVDTQISRLGGPNFHELPINAPLAQVHNNQRDGMHRQAIHRGRVSYEPNSLGGGCPFQAGAAGFVSFPREVEGSKLRVKPPLFAEHYAQATLFYASQSPVEQAHIAAAFRFELSKITVPAIRRRMISSLVNVSPKLAAEVAEGIGIEVPEAMPRAVTRVPKYPIRSSPALSMMARPGDGSLRSLRVMLLVAPGLDAAPTSALHDTLRQQGAVPRLVGIRIGAVQAADGSMLEAEASMETEPSFLFDALVLPAGARAIEALAPLGHTAECIQNAYRHCKPILALGESHALLEAAGAFHKLPDGKEDPGVVIGKHEADGGVARFLEALRVRRHFERETDPPRT